MRSELTLFFASCLSGYLFCELPQWLFVNRSVLQKNIMQMG